MNENITEDFQTVIKNIGPIVGQIYKTWVRYVNYIDQIVIYLRSFKLTLGDIYNMYLS